MLAHLFRLRAAVLSLSVAFFFVCLFFQLHGLATRVFHFTPKREATAISSQDFFKKEFK